MTDPVETMLRQAMADEATRAPTPDDLAGVARRRVTRRRRLDALGAVTVVVAVIAGVVVVGVNRTPDHLGRPPSPAASVLEPSPVTAPPGTRLVGIGHAAVAVPDRWGTNQTQCRVPQQDTVVIDVGVFPACATSRPAGVESVELWQGRPRFDFAADETIEIDAVPAQKQRTTCGPGMIKGTVCAGAVYLPSLKAGFRAESSTSAAEVDRILSWIRIVPDAVAVPGYQQLAADAQGNGQQQYLEVLQAAGLTVQVRTRKMPAVPAGLVLGISPAAGTVVAPGSVVTVTVVAEPEGPADEVRVGMNSEDTQGEYRDLDDAAIRAGATIRLGRADRIWAYADGKRAGTLAGQLDGESLAVDGWKAGPNYPHSWIAVTPGRTKITLTVTADGAPVVLGVVTVVVR